MSVLNSLKIKYKFQIKYILVVYNEHIFQKERIYAKFKYSRFGPFQDRLQEVAGRMIFNRRSYFWKIKIEQKR